MPSIEFGSGLLSGVSQALLAKEQRTHEDTQKAKSAALSTALSLLPHVSDPNELAPIIREALGESGAKPNKNKPSGVDHVLTMLSGLFGGKKQAPTAAAPTAGFSGTEENLASGGGGATQAPILSGAAPAPAAQGSPATSGLRFLTAEDKTKQAAAAEGASTDARVTADIEAKLKMAGRLMEFDPTMSRTEALEKVGLKGFAQPKMAAPKPLGKPIAWEDGMKDEDGNVIAKPAESSVVYQPMSVQQPDGTWDVRYTKTATAAPKSRTLDARAAELTALNPTKTPTEIMVMAATELAHERRTALAEKKTRLNQYLKLSASQLEKNAEALDYMQKNAPLMLEARRIGIDMAKAKKLTAEGFAKLLTNEPESAVSGQDPAEIAKQLENEGFEPDAAPKVPVKAPTVKSSAADDITKLASLNAQFMAATDPTVKAKIQADVKALLAKIQGQK